MRHLLFQSLGILSVGGVFLAGAAGAQSPPAQSGDAAAGSASSKPENSPPPKKVYTNEDLNGAGSGGVSVTGNSKGQKKSATSAKNEQREQAYWHSRAQRLRNQIEEVDGQIAQVKAREPQNSTSPGNSNATTGSTPIYFGGQYGRQKNLEARKAALEKQMESLEEEARKAGVPPGWLR